MASYVESNQGVTVEARVSELVPAELSEKVFALSQLAQWRLPLSGTVRFELDSEGAITKGEAALTADAGEVGFSDHVAEPVRVDGGTIYLAYEPSNGDIDLSDSELSIGGTQVALTGKIQQLRDDQGLLNALRISFQARNMDTTDKDGFSQVDVRGLAWTREGRFDL